MPTVYLNNLTNPRIVGTPNSPSIQALVPSTATYTDIHLDLEQQQNVGLGLNPAISNDIVVDTDINAIKNAIRNIFTTIPGQKILTPDFGGSLEAFIFDAVNPATGKIIGDRILNNINTFEPRVKVININIYPLPDQQMYYISLQYQIIGTGNTSNITIQISPNNFSIT